MKQCLRLRQIPLKCRIGGVMSLLHMQETNQPALKKIQIKSVNSVYVRSHCLFLEKECFCLQDHPSLDNPAVKDIMAWLMHYLQCCNHRKTL